MDRGSGSEALTKRIRIWGIVQGVGFRPFIAKLADAMKIKGEVRNLGGLVDVVITDHEEPIARFIEAIQTNKPLPAEIVHIKVEEIPLRRFDAFTILDSQEGEQAASEPAMIPADLAICPDCLKEMQDTENPRYGHPYISCMACGPRYTIIDRMPYDRENTAMMDFPLCAFCRGEYEDRENRRYHAQTISCHDCGPYNRLLLQMPGQDSQDPNHAEKPNHTENHNHGEDNRKTIAKAAALIMDGEILAVKGIGGYNFICSPFNKATVKTLRLIKKREEKPFAILFKDVEQIRTYCQVDENEARLLNSSARPILLLERNPHRDETKSPAIPSEVIRTSRFIGAFLPSTGLHYQLVSACGPLIATSANTSEAPMIKDDKEMRCKIEELQGRSWKIEGAENALLTGNQPEIRFGMLYNQREVRERLDDSVVRVIDNQPQMIRRAKGYAPVPLRIAGDQPDSGDRILATGGQLKASFCLTKGNFAYVSQFFGDLDQQQSCKIYDENVARLKTFFGIEPSLLVHDLHPLYYTTGFAEGYSKEFSRELIHGLLGVQHHHAHVASVMAEHDLVGPVLGVSFDGTGYGTDGAIWGGEFLICDAADFKRAAHLDYVSMLGGDASMKEGWKSAMCYGVAYGLAWPETDERYSLIKAGLEHQINTIRSTSMGRLFDAMASYLDIHHVNRYEGECAIMLENFAAEALKKGLSPYPMTFDIEEGGISARRIFEAADTGLKAGVSREALALGFHYAVADMILRVCSLIRDQEGINQIALTGGVFQNKIVMERSLKLLRSEAFSVYYNISVGPNDGGISLGQAYIGIQHLAQIRRKSCV